MKQWRGSTERLSDGESIFTAKHMACGQSSFLDLPEVPEALRKLVAIELDLPRSGAAGNE